MLRRIGGGGGWAVGGGERPARPREVRAGGGGAGGGDHAPLSIDRWFLMVRWLLFFLAQPCFLGRGRMGPGGAVAAGWLAGWRAAAATMSTTTMSEHSDEQTRRLKFIKIILIL